MIDPLGDKTAKDWENALKQDLIPESDVVVINNEFMISGAFINYTPLLGITPSNLSHFGYSDTYFYETQKKYASFELNFWVLDGTFTVRNADEEITGYISNGISDGNCILSNDSKVYGVRLGVKDGKTTAIQKIITISFTPLLEIIPAEIVVTDGKNAKTFNFEELAMNSYIDRNKYVYLDIGTTFSEYPLTIEITKTNLPYRRGRISDITMGFLFYADKDNMTDFEHTKSCKLDMSEFFNNTANITLVNFNNYFDNLMQNGTSKIKLQNSYIYEIYYGLKFENEWSYAHADVLYFKDLSIDRDNSTLKLELSTTAFNENNQKYNMSLIGQNATSPHDWMNFRYFIKSIISQLNITTADKNSLETTLNVLNNIDENRTSWRGGIYTDSTDVNSNNAFKNEKLIDLLREAIIFCNGVLVSDIGLLKIKKLVGTSGRITSDSFDHKNEYTVDQKQYLKYPNIEDLKEINSIVVKTCQLHNQDETVTQTTDGQNIPPSSHTFEFKQNSNDKNTSAEVELNCLCIQSNPDQLSETKWKWSDPQFTTLYYYIKTFNSGFRITADEMIISPLLEVTDPIHLSLPNRGQPFYGYVEEITITYNGTFTGKLVVNSPYFYSE